MPPPTSHQSGLRARKRTATQIRIVEAAGQLVTDFGYERTTVAMICDASEISAGTFFNYFGSKESVFLGPGLPLPSEDATETFTRARGNVLLDLHDLLQRARSDGPELNHDLFLLQRSIIAKSPTLTGLEVARFAAAEERLSEIVLRRLRDEGRSETPAELSAQAHTAVQLVAILGQHVMNHWAVHDDFSAGDDVARAQIALMHRLTAPPAP